jgi:hypothetical protein
MDNQPKPKGRPPKPPADRYRTPVRQLGRVDDATWHTLQQAAERSGKTFTAWAIAVLKRAAKRVK